MQANNHPKPFSVSVPFADLARQVPTRPELEWKGWPENHKCLYIMYSQMHWDFANSHSGTHRACIHALRPFCQKHCTSTIYPCFWPTLFTWQGCTSVRWRWWHRKLAFGGCSWAAPGCPAPRWAGRRWQWWARQRRHLCVCGGGGGGRRSGQGRQWSRDQGVATTSKRIWFKGLLLARARCSIMQAATLSIHPIIFYPEGHGYIERRRNAVAQWLMMDKQESTFAGSCGRTISRLQRNEVDTEGHSLSALSSSSTLSLAKSAFIPSSSNMGLQKQGAGLAA